MQSEGFLEVHEANVPLRPYAERKVNAPNGCFCTNAINNHGGIHARLRSPKWRISQLKKGRQAMKRPNSEPPNSAYEVGYGKPPTANRFRKGRTGNPSGRKRGEENLISTFKRHVLKRVKIKDGDRIRTITLAEAVILKNCNAALQKNPLAMGNIFRLAEESGEFVDRTNAKQVGGPIAVPVRSKNMEEFLAEFGRKNWGRMTCLSQTTSRPRH
jgi:hypothetical protein